MNWRVSVYPLLLLGMVSTVARAGHIDVSLDRAGLRTKIATNEGYLNYPAGNNPRGEERTGWTDIRHPALRGIPDEKKGFDRSDHRVDVANVQVKGSNFDARPDIARDFDFANEIYAQGGLFIRESEPLKFQNNPAVSAPLSDRERSLIQQDNRSGNSRTVNNYYAGAIAGGLLGITRTPGDSATTSGTMVNPALAAADTFAHELGHFLLDQHVTSGAITSSHHPSTTNLMFRNTNNPSAATKESGGAPSEPGRPNGNGRAVSIGGKDILTTGVSNRNPGVRLDGTGPEISQIEAIYASRYIKSSNHAGSFADRADFDWVEDNRNLSGIPGADDHPLRGDDPLVWDNQGIVPPTNHVALDHDHFNWGELNLNAYGTNPFNVVDVVSQILRYTDMDIDDSGTWSRRESALDYMVQFSLTGLGDWIDGVVSDVFVEGWTTLSNAEDDIARWQSPINANYVRINALFGDGHDGNTQIDAVIAGFVPRPVGAPPVWLLLLSGWVLLTLCRCRQRRSVRGVTSRSDLELSSRPIQGEIDGVVPH